MAVAKSKCNAEWRQVPSFPKYWASSDGLIKGPRGRVLRPGNSNGYLYVRVSAPSGFLTRAVHSLICEAFHGPRPAGKQCAHGDGIRANNKPSNLRWATNDENRQDMKLHGTWPAGAQHPGTKLTTTDVAHIRAHYAQNMGRKRVRRGTRQALAKRFGVSIHVIKDIVAGRSWIEGEQ